jgi:hypothetical protein
MTSLNCTTPIPRITLIPDDLRTAFTGALRRTVFGATLAASFLLGGCAASSDQGAGNAASAQSPPAGSSTDQLAPDLPKGKFTVQLGAFQSQEGASSVASLAKTRFSRDVYTILNDKDGLFKVMLGAFDTKDLARAFRDTIVREYPQEYKDAWVSELAR